MFTSRFSSGLVILEYMKGFKRELCRHLSGALYRCGESVTRFEKIS